jgi:ferredoxin
MRTATTRTLDLDDLQRLIDLLHQDGWTVLGPRVADGVVGNLPITSLDDLPRGTGDVQEPAGYRLRPRTDDALFGYAVGPQSWKSSLFPARELLRRTTPDGDTDAGRPSDVPRLALVGVRSCDLHAIAVHDRVLRDRPFTDARYAERRDQVLVVAVTCSAPAGTCFCASMGTGPEPHDGFDVALTEVLDDGHRFVARAGTERGADLLDRLAANPATDGDLAAAADVVDRATSAMGRTLDPTDLRDLLYANADHPQWDDVARRCLACGNCTLVCPTCFCTTVSDTTSLVDGTSERTRLWDSCFTGEFTHLESGDVRSSTRSRYRQWATHKLAAWWDQFGASGCVGCGRCVTWCPAAIDITAEVAAIRASSPVAPDGSEA